MALKKYAASIGFAFVLAAAGQTLPAGPRVPAQNAGQPPSIALSPAVVMARGAFGQGLTQTLSLSNQTAVDFSFDLVAQDVLVKDGKRVFVAAGETEHSIASTAVFSRSSVLVKAFTTETVDIRITIPSETKVRAIVAMFRGTNKLPTSNSSVGMTASLGALLTFNLTENVKLAPEAVQVKSATETANLTISQWIANTGTEPVLPEGMAAILNTQGALVGKASFPSQRLLPGERLEYTAEYPEQLPPGSYKALSSFQFEGKTLTNDTTFKVP